MNVSMVALRSRFHAVSEFPWKKVLWLTALSVGTGLALVFALPVRVS